VWAVPGIPEVSAGDHLPSLLVGWVGDLQDGDILVVSSKIVSKAEGRLIAATDREDAITAETVRVVASRRHPGGVTRIVENPLGIVQAAAGVDSSNVPEGYVLLLPVDPDASARAIARAFADRGTRIGVIVSDTLGRPWRVGQTDAAIGAAGVLVVDDLRGTADAGGRALDVTVPAVADEIASAADLVKGKAASLPVAVVRGLGRLVTSLDAPGARALVRPAEQDMFRTGSDEAYAAGFRDGSASAAP
jgi:coenzyme F420-0:L-glutamate ligase/coenzyme F420-1:gamma-L-glutamate ligase